MNSNCFSFFSLFAKTIMQNVSLFKITLLGMEYYHIFFRFHKFFVKFNIEWLPRCIYKDKNRIVIISKNKYFLWERYHNFIGFCIYLFCYGSRYSSYVLTTLNIHIKFEQDEAWIKRCVYKGLDKSRTFENNVFFEQNTPLNSLVLQKSLGQNSITGRTNIFQTARKNAGA